MAMLDGGPTTEFGMPVRFWTDGGKLAKSRIEIESGAIGGMTLGPPDVRSILFSLPEMTICAEAGAFSVRIRIPIEASLQTPAPSRSCATASGKRVGLARVRRRLVDEL